MEKFRFLFVSVDSSPKIGGISLLAKHVSKSLLELYGEEAVYLGPKGTYFVDSELPMKVYEDFQSDDKLRAGPYAKAEDDRIQDLTSAILDNYALNCVVMWHPFYYGLGVIHAAHARKISVAVFVHGTELTSQIPGVRYGPVDFDYDPESTELSHRLFGTMDQADLILTNSSYSAKLINNLMPNKTVSVVGCGIDEALFKREIARQPSYSRIMKLMAREDTKLPERKTFIHIGRLVPHKNQRQSIELMQYMPDAQLLIIGDGPIRADLEQYSQDLKLEDRVFFLGEVDDAAKWAYLRASDAGLLISNFNDETGGYEGFGITMVEYTAAACVVISTGQYGMADFAKKYECAFLALHDEASTETHAKRVIDFIDDEEGVIQHIEKTRQISLQRFTWAEVARRTMMAIQDV